MTRAMSSSLSPWIHFVRGQVGPLAAAAGAAVTAAAQAAKQRLAFRQGGWSAVAPASGRLALSWAARTGCLPQNRNSPPRAQPEPGRRRTRSQDGDCVSRAKISSNAWGSLSPPTRISRAAAVRCLARVLSSTYAFAHPPGRAATPLATHSANSGQKSRARASISSRDRRFRSCLASDASRDVFDRSYSAARIVSFGFALLVVRLHARAGRRLPPALPHSGHKPSLRSPRFTDHRCAKRPHVTVGASIPGSSLPFSLLTIQQGGRNVLVRPCGMVVDQTSSGQREWIIVFRRRFNGIADGSVSSNCLSRLGRIPSKVAVPLFS